jgi:hypothetical protein
MMLADAEDVEADLPGVPDLLEEIAQPIMPADSEARVAIGPREAVDSDFHLRPQVEPAINNRDPPAILSAGRRCGTPLADSRSAVEHGRAGRGQDPADLPGRLHYCDAIGQTFPPRLGKRAA